MTHRVRYPWWLEPATWLGAQLMRMLGATWRIERDGDDPSESDDPRRERAIFAFWHSQLLPLVYTHRDRDAAVLVSQHFDGQVIARILERLGYRTARGSSTRGGGEGVRALLAHAQLGRDLAVTPDGPRGPGEVVKPGVIYLASRSGLPVIPVAAASHPSRRLRSWDRFRVPGPFARVRVTVGAPLRVPAVLDDAGEERWRLRLENELREMTTRVRATVGEPR